MKRSNLKYLFVAAGMTIGVTAISIYSCEKQVFTPNTADAVSNDPTKFITEPGAICGEMVEKTIVDKKGHSVGQAIVYNDTKYFYVIMTPNDGKLLSAASMNISDKMEGIPMTSAGDPDVANYGYQIGSRPASTMRKFRVPLAQVPSHAIVSVAVDVVNPNESGNPAASNKQTAWIDGRVIGDAVTGRAFSYAHQNCLTTDGVSDDELKLAVPATEVCGEVVNTVIVDKDNKEVGKAAVYNDTKFFYVSLSGYKNYMVSDAYMQVSNNMTDFALDASGNAVYQKYEYTLPARNETSTRTFKIPLSEINGNSYVSIAVKMDENDGIRHDVICYVNGRYISNGRGAKAFSYTKQNCMTTDGVSDSPAK